MERKRSDHMSRQSKLARTKNGAVVLNKVKRVFAIEMITVQHGIFTCIASNMSHLAIKHKDSQLHNDSDGQAPTLHLAFKG
jgi:hypothetical protein